MIKRESSRFSFPCRKVSKMELGIGLVGIGGIVHRQFINGKRRRDFPAVGHRLFSVNVR